MSARALLLAMIDIDPAHEEEFNRWYEEEHLPDRENCPGFLSARRFVAAEGSPKYLALYDLESRDVLASPAYMKIYDPPTAWTKAIQKHFRTVVRNVYEDITAAPRDGRTGDGLLLVMADVPTDREEDFNRWYDEEHVAERLSVPGFLRARRFRALEGGPKYLALYDLISMDVLQTDAYRRHLGPGQTPWSARMTNAMINYRRNVYVAHRRGT